MVMTQAQAITRLRKALVGLIGASAADELKQMELALRALPAPAEDQAVAVDAIKALLDVHEEFAASQLHGQEPVAWHIEHPDGLVVVLKEQDVDEFMLRQGTADGLVLRPLIFGDTAPPAPAASSYNSSDIDLTACQLLEALMMAGDPEFDTDFDDRGRVRIFYNEAGHSGPGVYCECVDAEEEGCILLDGTAPSIRAAPAAVPCQSDHSAEDRFEQFVQAEIARSPNALRELGEYLGRVLGEDEFPSANRLLLQLATEYTAPAAVPVELIGVSDQINAGNGFWRACSGCHELNEGMETGPYSAGLRCHLGNGCGECGGIGAIWDNADYQAIADEEATALATHPQPEAAGGDA
ncbi:hypothetical protein ST27_10095 [Xanthomonas phaseoli pv. phaseoli]|uniref:hypothetical protein n=1 Tax=Xanthomonas phaseoli TaxID=1985254 RepID=UPI0005960A6E|nr:hypothetical protein [Xanthomonas phaseoli]KIJ00443.1 hypothetical protein ST27_10095 [Xanthomonas phaseoli pv. phaseoli]UZB30968.1 hypothetical protein OM951_11095 [Xanthomonas phaseoli pv. phaseoli]